MTNRVIVDTCATITEISGDNVSVDTITNRTITDTETGETIVENMTPPDTSAFESEKVELPKDLKPSFLGFLTGLVPTVAMGLGLLSSWAVAL